MSPVHALVPLLCVVEFGPGAAATLPDVNITPELKGKFGFVFVNDPIPFVLPKLVPVLQVIFVSVPAQAPPPIEDPNKTS